MTRRLSHQATAFAFAAFMTLAILGGVDRQATAAPSPQLVAHVMQGAASS